MRNSNRISRRSFLQIIAVGAVAGATAKLGFDALSAPEPVSATRLLMGTVVNLTIISDDKAAAQSAIDATLTRMAELEGVLSRFQPQSQLSQLNQTGRLADAHPALLGLIAQARQLSDQSGGAFDITIKPLVDLYESTSPPTPCPRTPRLSALHQVDYRAIHVDGNRIAFNRPGMAITLDGIAKGFIVDEGIAVLKRLALPTCLWKPGAI